MDLYQAYIMHKMINGETTDLIMNELYSEKSVDGKSLRLTICNIGENPTNNNNSNVSIKQPNFLKRMFHKIFG